MDETEARFSLLQKEIEYIQQGIRAFDTVTFQVKGWCITVAGAIGGLAASQQQRAITTLALATTAAFWLVDAHYKSVQRTFLQYQAALERKLAGKEILDLLARGAVLVPNLSRGLLDHRHPVKTNWGRTKREVALVWKEASRPLTYNLYVFVAACLVIEFIALR